MNFSETYRTPDILEAILFAAGAPVAIKDLTEATDWTEDVIVQAVEALNETYIAQNKGFQIIRLEHAFQMCTRPEFAPYIQRVLGAKPKQGLSIAALETLSIIAYNQPITRNSITYIRGVNSDGAVSRLLERGLIEEKGRLNAPGRPMLYVTTEDFLRAFGLSSLSDLPDIEQPLPDQLDIDNQQEFDFT